MSASETMSDREKLIREGFCFDSDRDCEAARYLMGVIDVIRSDRDRMREEWASAKQVTEERDALLAAIRLTVASTKKVCSACEDQCQGSQFEHMEDLRLLCHKCHGMLHEIETILLAKLRHGAL